MTALDILTKNNLRITPGRLHILNQIIESKSAVSEKDIQNKLKNLCDRATIYRTLKTFENLGIINAIATEENVTRFLLEKNPKEHIHFKCTDCGDIVCLHDVLVEQYSLPEGYKKKDSNFLIIGTCIDCNE